MAVIRPKPKVHTRGTAHYIDQAELLAEICLSQEHKRVTERAGKMILMLCERYSMKLNFRSYSYRDEMVAAAIMQCLHGALIFDVKRGTSPLAYLTTCAHNSFLRIINLEHRQTSIRDDVLEIHAMRPSSKRQSENEEGRSSEPILAKVKKVQKTATKRGPKPKENRP